MKSKYHLVLTKEALFGQTCHEVVVLCVDLDLSLLDHVEVRHLLVRLNDDLSVLGLAADDVLEQLDHDPGRNLDVGLHILEDLVEELPLRLDYKGHELLLQLRGYLLEELVRLDLPEVELEVDLDQLLPLQNGVVRQKLILVQPLDVIVD